jgi:hypothetical protein
MTPVEIVDKVNAFYSGAFTQLITLTLAVLAFAGVILPILIQMIQSRTFRTEQKSLEARIDERLTAVKSKLADEVETKFQSEKANFEKIIADKMSVVDGKLKELAANTRGGTLFVQARFEASQRRFDLAGSCFASAADCLLQGNDEKNAQRAIRQLVEECLPELNKAAFENVEDFEEATQQLIKTLEGKNEHDRYEDTIGSIRRELSNAKLREPPT